MKQLAPRFARPTGSDMTAESERTDGLTIRDGCKLIKACMRYNFGTGEWHGIWHSTSSVHVHRLIFALWQEEHLRLKCLSLLLVRSSRSTPGAIWPLLVVRTFHALATLLCYACINLFNTCKCHGSFSRCKLEKEMGETSLTMIVQQGYVRKIAKITKSRWAGWGRTTSFSHNTDAVRAAADSVSCMWSPFVLIEALASAV